MQNASSPRPRGNPSWRKGGPSPNPSGRGGAKLAAAAPRTDTAVRADGWANLVSNIGVLGKDKRQRTTFTSDVVGYAEARDLWQGDDIAAKVVEALPADVMREGFEIKIKSDDGEGKELSEDVDARLEALQLNAKVKKALEFKRAYGGAAIFPVINDGAFFLASPMNEKRIGEITNLVVFEPRELQPIRWYTDIMHPKFRQPEVYRLTPNVANGHGTIAVQEIHESRLVIFQGITVSTDQATTGTLFGWGDSVFTRLWRVLRDFNAAWDSTGVLVSDFAQTIWKIKDLAEMIAADRADLFKTRIQMASYSQGIVNAMMLDAEGEDFERKSVNVTGLPDLLDRYLARVAAAATMPITKLFGMSPGGMNATGESDTRGWYDTVGTEQDDVKPMIERLVRLVLLELGGVTNGKEPENWSIEWCPLWQESAKETAETRKLTAETDTMNITNGVVTPDEVRKSRFGGDTYSAETQIDTDEANEEDDDLTPEEIASARTMQPGPGGKPVPGAPPIGVGAPGAAPPVDAAKAAFSGVQVTALIDVVKAAGAKEISRESAAAIIELAFPVDAAQAQKILGPVDFKPVVPEPPSPFGGGGGFGGKPGAPKPGEPPAPGEKPAGGPPAAAAAPKAEPPKVK